MVKKTINDHTFTDEQVQRIISQLAEEDALQRYNSSESNDPNLESVIDTGVQAGYKPERIREVAAEVVKESGRKREERRGRFFKAGVALATLLTAGILVYEGEKIREGNMPVRVTVTGERGSVVTQACPNRNEREYVLDVQADDGQQYSFQVEDGPRGMGEFYKPLEVLAEDISPGDKITVPGSALNHNHWQEVKSDRIAKITSPQGLLYPINQDHSE